MVGKPNDRDIESRDDDQNFRRYLLELIRDC